MREGGRGHSLGMPSQAAANAIRIYARTYTLVSAVNGCGCPSLQEQISTPSLPLSLPLSPSLPFSYFLPSPLSILPLFFPHFPPPHTEHMQDKTIQREDEFSDSEDEDDRRDEATHKEDNAPSRKRARTASPNPSADAAQPPQGGASPPRPEPSPITPGVALEGVASQAQGAVPPEVVPPPKPSPLTTTVASTTTAAPASPEATAKKTDE